MLTISSWQVRDSEVATNATNCTGDEHLPTRDEGEEATLLSGSTEDEAQQVDGIYVSFPLHAVAPLDLLVLIIYSCGADNSCVW